MFSVGSPTKRLDVEKAIGWHGDGAQGARLTGGVGGGGYPVIATLRLADGDVDACGGGGGGGLGGVR